MTILSDNTIRKYVHNRMLIIDPVPEDNCFQPASIDIHLGYTFVQKAKRDTPNEYHEGLYTLKPLQFVLGSTIERVEIPDFLVCQVNGKSSWARKGLIVHATAGFLDPGFKGNITLEFFNMSDEDIVLKPGVAICQLVFTMLTSCVDRPYGHPDLKSHYQNQVKTQVALA